MREAPTLTSIGNLLPSYLIIGCDEEISGIEGGFLPRFATQLESVRKLKTGELKVTNFQILIPRDLHHALFEYLEQFNKNLLGNLAERDK